MPPRLSDPPRTILTRDPRFFHPPSFLLLVVKVLFPKVPPIDGANPIALQLTFELVKVVCAVSTEGMKVSIKKLPLDPLTRIKSIDLLASFERSVGK